MSRTRLPNLPARSAAVQAAAAPFHQSLVWKQSIAAAAAGKTETRATAFRSNVNGSAAPHGRARSKATTDPSLFQLSRGAVTGSAANSARSIISCDVEADKNSAVWKCDGNDLAESTRPGQSSRGTSGASAERSHREAGTCATDCSHR